MYKLNKRDNNLRENPKHKTHKDSNKQQLINYIYSTVDLSRFKYDILKTDSDLPKLLEKKYYITPNFYGSNCLLIFTRLRERYYTFLVDRRTLSYYKDKVDMNRVFLEYVSVEVDSSVYNGTIFDGTYVKKRGVNQYIISDVYKFKGSDYTNVDLDHKMAEVGGYLRNSHADISILKNRHKYYPELELNINSVHDVSKIEKFIYKTVPKYTDCKIRGIDFYPEKSGTKLVFIFNNTHNAYNTKSSKNMRKVSSSSESKSSRRTEYKYMSTVDGHVHSVLEMQSTPQPEVYKLHAIEKDKSGPKPVYRRVKMGIAHIPTTKRSKWCRDVMTKSSKGRLLVKCLFHDNVGKWEPVKIESEKKKPDRIKDIKVKQVKVESD